MEVGEIVRELKARARDATPERWYVVESPWLSTETTYVIAGSNDPHAGDFVCEGRDPWTEGVEGEDDEDIDRRAEQLIEQDWANMRYIAAASPERIELILDELERLQKIEQQVLDERRERRERRGMAERLPLMAEHYAYYLLGLDKDGAIVQEDGGHRGPDGVTTAMKLFHRLGFVREGVTYIMVKSSPVPDMEVQINEEAAATCRWMLDEYGGKAQDGSSATLEDVALVEEMDWTYRVYRAKKLAKGKAYFSEFVTGYETSGGQRRAKEDAIDHARAISSEVWFSPEESGQWRLLEAQDG